MRAAFMYGAGRRPGGGSRRPEAGAADGRAGADRARLRVRQRPAPLPRAAGQPDVDAAVDAEYARKYQGATSAIAHITSPLARVTTMRVEPR